MPWGCIWMTNKTSALYDAAFASLSVHLPPGCHPEHLMCDYEHSLRNSLTSVFPGVEPDRCYFHWAQAVFKKINNKGLTIPFRTNRRFKRWCLMAMALPLLPPDKIMEAWASLRQDPVASLASYERRQWVELQNYIEEYWLHTIGPNIISVAFAPRRTNNEVERFNKGLNQRARVSHPPIFSIASVVSNELDNSARDIRSMNNGNPVREDSRRMFAAREAKLQRLQHAVRRGQLHPFDFICKAAKTNKKYMLMMYQAMQHHTRRLGGEEEEEEEEQEYLSDTSTSSSEEVPPAQHPAQDGHEEESPASQPDPPTEQRPVPAPRSLSQPQAASPALTRSRARRLNLREVRRL